MNPYSWAEVEQCISASSSIFIKKLARNDCKWADGPENGHQNGVYIPREIQGTDFFPVLKNKNIRKPHIYETFFDSVWPQTGEIKKSRLTHYSNKGSEVHFTRIPREIFSNLSPASLLIGGTAITENQEKKYWFMVLDSNSDEAEMLESMLDLNSEFKFGIFTLNDFAGNKFLGETEQLIQDLDAALRNGTLNQFIQRASLPKTTEFSSHAQQIWLTESGKSSLSPWEMDCPGDAIKRISRDIEYTLFKRAEIRLHAAKMLSTLVQRKPLTHAIVHGFSDINSTFLSAAQTRKSRAGLSFEYHMARMFKDGNIRFEEQAIISSRRPDFVLPNVMTLKSTSRSYIDAMIVSLKTTLRERWKQLSLERIRGALFLATVDDRVTADAIADMGENGICLLVPESLKNAKEACYAGQKNVITFREFFDNEISRRRPALRLKPD